MDTTNTPPPITIETSPEKATKPLYPTIIDLLAILGIFFVSYILSTYITRLCGYTFDSLALNGSDEMLRKAAQIDKGVFSLISYSMCMTVTCIATFILGKFRGNKAPIARLNLAGFNPTLLLWSMLMLFCVTIIFDPLSQLLPSVPALSGRGWAMVTLLIVVAPVFEELLCRGMILEAVRAKRGGWIAVCVSSLFFAVLHLHPTSSLNALIVGVILSYIYIRSSSLFAPIILHSFNNALAYILIWLGLSEISLRDIIPSVPIYGAVYVGALVALALSLFKIIRELRVKK